MKNLYQTLGVSPFASDEEIRVAIEIAQESGKLGLNDLQAIQGNLRDQRTRREYDCRLVEDMGRMGFQPFEIKYSSKTLRRHLESRARQSVADQAVDKLLSEAQNMDLGAVMERDLKRAAEENKRRRDKIVDFAGAALVFFVGVFFCMGMYYRLKGG